MPKLDTTIESFVSFLNDPSWKPVDVKGYNFLTDLSWFRRAVPVAMLSEIEGGHILFKEATLDIAGVRHHACVSIQNGLPGYAAIKATSRVPQRYQRLAGSPHVMRRAQNIGGILGSETRMICVESCVVYRGQGRWIACPVIDPRVDGGIQEDAPDAAMALAASAFAERYHAHMEFECGNGTSAAVPLNLPQIREVLKDRDKPETGDRRPALCHLVRQHRRMRNDEAIQVREHLRGKIACHWRGWDVVLWPSVYDIERLKREDR